MLNDRWMHARTPAEELREALMLLENSLGKLEYSGRVEALDILSLFDHAFALLTELQAQGAIFPGEQARFETVKATFRRKANKFLRTVGGTPALERGREILAPDAARWWWFVDAWQAEQKRAQLVRTFLLWGIAATVLAALTVLYMVFLRPDTATRAWIHHQNAAELLAVSGDYANALAEVNAALAVKPNAMELHVLKGVLEEGLDHTQEAQKSFSRAQVFAENQETLLLERAQKYLLLRVPDLAMADAENILAKNAKSVYAHLLKAQIYESQDALAEATNAYTVAVELATAANQMKLVAIIRVQQAYFLQRMMTVTP